MNEEKFYNEFIDFLRFFSKKKDFIPLHEPTFIGNEKKYLNECIDSTFVSSIGEFVDKVEAKIATYIGTKYAVATCNGTAALHIALILADVQNGDEVITQPLTFIATCNAISYCNASPVFVDVDKETMGLSPNSLQDFLNKNTILKNEQCINKISGKVIKACLPMHTYGHPCRIDEIRKICDKYKITLVEDAAESLGSKYQGQHTGTFGSLGVFSFNGNKVITSGGGGCIVTNNKHFANKAKHLTTTAKVGHQWAFTHDMIGFNYRMPNLNAALLLGQLENLDSFITKKRKLADKYIDYFDKSFCSFIKEPCCGESNYWLNSILLENKKQRDVFLQLTNSKGVMTRPVWGLMYKQKMFNSCFAEGLENAEWLEKRLINIPSSPTLMDYEEKNEKK